MWGAGDFVGDAVLQGRGKPVASITTQHVLTSRLQGLTALPTICFADQSPGRSGGRGELRQGADGGPQALHGGSPKPAPGSVKVCDEPGSACTANAC